MNRWRFLAGTPGFVAGCPWGRGAYDMAPLQEEGALAQTQTTGEAPFVRPDGKEKVTGSGRYTADLTLTGQAYARFRYADHPHARIVRVDASKARALSGVLAVLTHEDVPDVKYGGMVQDRFLFAKDRVPVRGRHRRGGGRDQRGDRSGRGRSHRGRIRAAAALSATSRPPAKKAPRSSTRTGLRTSATRTCVPGQPLGYSTIVKGDADAAMATADVVVKGRYVSDPSHGVPIEPHAVIAQWQGDKVTIWSSTQVPYIARSGVAHTLQIPESNVRVIVPLLGGGFGAKCDFHFEAHVAVLARAAGRPVKLVFSRRRSSSRSITAARAWSWSSRRAPGATGPSSRAAPSSCSTRARTAARAGSWRRWRPCTPAGLTRWSTCSSSRS